MEHLVMSNNNIISYSMKNIINETKGKKFTTGTITFATPQNRPIITHNLGVVPTYFFMIVKDKTLNFTFNAEDRPPTGLYGAYIVKCFWGLKEYLTGENIQTNAGGYCLEWRNNNSTALTWSNNTTQPFTINETIANLNYRVGGQTYPANIEFEWIAIE